MALKDALKVSRKTFVNPTGWLGLNELQSQTNVIVNQIKALFIPATARFTETFEEAIARLGISENEVQAIMVRYRYYAWMFAALTSVTLLYSFYYIFHFHLFRGWVLLLATAVLFASQAFKYDFLSFQMKHRHLGCTFQEWWSGRLSAPIVETKS